MIARIVAAVEAHAADVVLRVYQLESQLKVRQYSILCRQCKEVFSHSQSWRVRCSPWRKALEFQLSVEKDEENCEEDKEEGKGGEDPGGS